VDEGAEKDSEDSLREKDGEENRGELDGSVWKMILVLSGGGLFSYFVTTLRHL